MTKTLLISSHAKCAVTSWFSIRLQLQLNNVSKSSADVTVTDNNGIYVSILSFVKEEAAEGSGGWSVGCCEGESDSCHRIS